MSDIVKVLRGFRPKKETHKSTKILLFAHLELFGCLEVRNWRLLKGPNGMSVGYPTSEPAKDGTVYKQVIPRSESLQEEILQALIRTYEGFLANEKVVQNEVI